MGTVRKQQEILVNVGVVNMFSLIAFVGVGGLSTAAYAVLHLSKNGGSMAVRLGLDSVSRAVLFLVAYVLLVYLHERVHGWGYLVLGGVKTEYRIQWKQLAVQSLAQSPMPIHAYRAAVALPTVVIALPLYVIGLAGGNFLLYLMGVLQLVGGVGDVVLLWVLRRIPGGCTAVDHPEKSGCIIYFPGTK